MLPPPAPLGLTPASLAATTSCDVALAAALAALAAVLAAVDCVRSRRPTGVGRPMCGGWGEPGEIPPGSKRDGAAVEGPRKRKRARGERRGEDLEIAALEARSGMRCCGKGVPPPELPAPREAPRVTDGGTTDTLPAPREAPRKIDGGTPDLPSPRETPREIDGGKPDRPGMPATPAVANCGEAGVRRADVPNDFW